MASASVVRNRPDANQPCIQPVHEVNASYLNINCICIYWYSSWVACIDNQVADPPMKNLPNPPRTDDGRSTGEHPSLQLALHPHQPFQLQFRLYTVIINIP